jgi:hypothetical protein
MSASITLTAVAELAAQLPPAEQKQLADDILRKLAGGTQATASRPRAWREIRGRVSYPLCGQDAQTWVSASRREAEEHREQQWRGDR